MHVHDWEMTPELARTHSRWAVERRSVRLEKELATFPSVQILELT